MVVVSLLAVLLGTSLALPASVETPTMEEKNSKAAAFAPAQVEVTDDGWAKCWTLLKAAGASDYYSGHVGHTVHSMSLHTLRRFKPDVGKDNGVPTINFNLTAMEGILENAPDTDTEASSQFASEGLWTLDQILSRMDEPIYDIRGFTVLERIAHAFHMEDMWSQVLPFYRKLEAKPPSRQTCACAADVERSGIKDFMRYTALTIREPGIVNGPMPKELGGGGVQYYVPYPTYTHHFWPDLNQRESYGRVIPYHFLKHGNELKDLLKKQPPLRSASAWKAWRKAVDSRQDVGCAPDTALFLYCALNKAH